MYKLSFKINNLPKITMNGPHSTYKARWREVVKWKKWVFCEVYNHKPPEPLTKAKCTFTRCSSVEPDDDNLRASFKSVRDGMIEAGILVNDKSVNMPNPTYQWIRGLKGKGFIQVDVEEIIS